MMFAALPDKPDHDALEREIDTFVIYTDSETWAHLAVAGDQIFVRELNVLTAHQWRAGDSKAASTP